MPLHLSSSYQADGVRFSTNRGLGHKCVRLPSAIYTCEARSLKKMRLQRQKLPKYAVDGELISMTSNEVVNKRTLVLLSATGKVELFVKNCYEAERKSDQNSIDFSSAYTFSLLAEKVWISILQNRTKTFGLSGGFRLLLAALFSVRASSSSDGICIPTPSPANDLPMMMEALQPGSSQSSVRCGGAFWIHNTQKLIQNKRSPKKNMSVCLVRWKTWTRLIGPLAPSNEALFCLVPTIQAQCSGLPHTIKPA
jgi:hypothetical protein